MCDWDDIPFLDKGRDFSGCDCWGYVILRGKEFGYDIPDYIYTHCRAIENIEKCREKGEESFDKIVSPIPGDVVIFKNAGTLHFGIMIDKYNVSHIGPTIGVRNNRIDHPVFSQTIEGFYRCKTRI